MMKNLKIGDKVRIRKDLKTYEKYGADVFASGMECMLGNIATITHFVCDKKKFRIKECNFNWTPEMVECKINPDRLIFRDNATILFKDGKRYVAKCEAGDTYDREKGLLVCLAKANGITFNDIQEMLSKAEFQREVPDRIKEVKREAEAGEYIKIVNEKCSFGFYKNGDILKVKGFYRDWFYSGVVINKQGCPYIHHDEYVVLENYKPNKQEQDNV